MLPELVAFDLDGTLWDISDMHDESSFRSVGTNLVRDGDGNELSLGHDLPRILNYLRDLKVPMAISSKNHNPRKARKALDLLMIERKGRKVSASSFFGDKIEISSDSKTLQLKRLKKKVDDKVSYNAMMMLIDNDKRKNGHVKKDLGVFFLHSTGPRLSWRVFKKGLDNFAANKEDDDDDDTD